MRASPLAVSLAVTLALATATAHAQGQLWVVDDSGGTGVDHTTIQAAVDGAADGDTIVVRSGSYPAFTIDGKALVVVTDAGASAGLSLGQGFQVVNLGARQHAVVRGLASSSIQLDSNAGTVWLEDIVQLGSIFGVFGGGSGLFVNASSSVVVSRCVLFGADAVGGPPFHGVHAVGSTVHLFDTTVTGGRNNATIGPVGGSGVEVASSFVYAAGCTITGGEGSPGGLCSAGGAGGPGLSAAAAGTPPVVLDSQLAGGLGGAALDFFYCPWRGPTGPASVGALTTLTGVARRYELGSPASGGAPTTLDYYGIPGDLVFSLVGLAPAPTYQPTLLGTLVLPILPLLLPHGATDPLGELHTTVPLPGLPPGTPAATFYAQAAAVIPSGAARVGQPSQITIL
jgi:hypothetical protein